MTKLKGMLMQKEAIEAMIFRAFDVERTWRMDYLGYKCSSPEIIRSHWYRYNDEAAKADLKRKILAKSYPPERIKEAEQVLFVMLPNATKVWGSKQHTVLTMVGHYVNVKNRSDHYGFGEAAKLTNIDCGTDICKSTAHRWWNKMMDHMVY